MYSGTAELKNVIIPNFLPSHNYKMAAMQASITDIKKLSPLLTYIKISLWYSAACLQTTFFKIGNLVQNSFLKHGICGRNSHYIEMIIQ